MDHPVAHIKYEPSAWRVDEQLSLPFAGHGEHAYFFVEKENLNTMDVVRALASACGLAPHDVGYAGLKDKHAITRQWFSVPLRTDVWPLCGGHASLGADTRVECLQVQRHTSKLRRGQHAANRFVLGLKFETPDDVATVELLDDWFPNRFGPQRVSAGNVTAAQAWLLDAARADGRQRRTRRGQARQRRGWHRSVLRSQLFNCVLDLRVARDCYHSKVEGDVLLEGIPTGPLWGRGRSAAQGAAAALENEALAAHRQVCDALEFTGVQQARRVLALRPAAFSWRPVPTSGDTAVAVSFELPPGAYATSLLAHKLALVDDSRRYD